MTAIELITNIVDTAADHGILVLLDLHRLNEDFIPELWCVHVIVSVTWLGSTHRTGVDPPINLPDPSTHPTKPPSGMTRSTRWTT